MSIKQVVKRLRPIIASLTLVFGLVSFGSGNQMANSSTARSNAPKIFLGDPSAITIKDLALAFAFKALQDDGVTNITGAQLIQVSNTLIPNLFPLSITLNPLNPKIDSFKYISDGSNALKIQDLAILFAAKALAEDNSPITSSNLGSVANNLLPKSLSISPSQFSNIQIPTSVVSSAITGVKLQSVIPYLTPLSTAAIAVKNPSFNLVGFSVAATDPYTQSTVNAQFGFRTVFSQYVRYQVSTLNSLVGDLGKNGLSVFLKGQQVLSIPGAENACVLVYSPPNLDPSDPSVNVLSKSNACP